MAADQDMGMGAAGVPPTEPALVDHAEPPGWPKGVGITSIVYSLLLITCLGLALLSFFFLMPMTAKMAEQQGDGALPPTMSLSPLKFALMGLQVLAAGTLLTAGITTVQRNPVGRPLHLLGAIGVLAVFVASFVIGQVIDRPAMAQFVQDHPKSMFAQRANPTRDLIVGCVTMLVMGAWPAFCLIWFGLVKRSGAAMGGGGPEPAA